MKLVERVYRLDSKKLLNAINKRSDIELHDFHQPESFKTLAEYLTAAGVDFDQTKSPQPGIPALKHIPKAFYYNHTKGLLYLRATEGEIDIVENALATHSNVVRFIENKGEIVGFALSQMFVYWGFDREKGSNPFTAPLFQRF